MNAYLVHRLCRQVLHDETFRTRIREDPAATVTAMPFDEVTRAALLTGDVGLLHRRGASGFLLLILSRFEIFGLDLPTFNRRMRREAGERDEPPVSNQQVSDRVGDSDG